LGSNGAILEVEFGRARVLLCPGADPEMIGALRAGGSIGPVSAVLLADGGYEGVNPTAWLSELNPLVAMISVEAGNPDGLPSPEVLLELEGRSVMRTDRHGWIDLTTDGERLWVEVEHNADIQSVSMP
jgi:beta-lactamase superfamily II metal-dependent hydrolase